MEKRHFGGVSSLILALAVLLTTACSTNVSAENYNRAKMVPIMVTVKYAMRIVKTSFKPSEIPSKLSEEEIAEAITARGKPLANFSLFDGDLEIEMVSDGQHIGAVVWDSDNDRLLIQDLRCTQKTDDQAWKAKKYGSGFTLDWSICP